jgi:hypothetical protein
MADRVDKGPIDQKAKCSLSIIEAEIYENAECTTLRYAFRIIRFLMLSPGWPMPLLRFEYLPL